MTTPAPHPSSAAGGRPAFSAVTPISDAIGAEIVGIDLRLPTDAATGAALREAWHRHCILLVRGQQIDEDEQVRFAEVFGALGKLVNISPGATKNPAVMFVSNVRKDGKLIGALPDGEMYFHSDQCYVGRPPAATMLYAMEIPSKGGNTLFANMYKAYEALPEPMKRRIEGRVALNVYDYANNATVRGSVIREGTPSFAHPVARVHPATGRTALYVNRLMTDHIVGMPREESDEILAFLFDHQEQPAFVYEHAWRPGDLIVWDNRCTLHARTDFDASERRMLRRVTILGDQAT